MATSPVDAVIVTKWSRNPARSMIAAYSYWITAETDWVAAIDIIFLG